MNNKRFFLSISLLIQLLNALFFIWIILIISKFSSQGIDLVPLHYTIYFGSDLIGSKHKLLILPSLSLILTNLNLFLAHLFFKKELFLSYLLIGAGFLLQVFLGLGAFFIIRNI